MISVGKIISLSFLSFGIFLLIQISLPLISFKIWELSQNYQNILLISPQPKVRSGVLGVSIERQDNFPLFVSSAARESKAAYTQFSVSLNSINLQGTTVEVDSNNIAKSLAHLPGSALPGEKGNVFISGHSALPLAIGRNINAPFSNLTKVEKGDQISVFAQGTTYNYQVISIKIVDPLETWVIAPPDSQGRYLTLMTCVPPGLNTKRLVVLGKLI